MFGYLATIFYHVPRLNVASFYVSSFLLSFVPCEMESCTNIIINDDFCQLPHIVFFGDPTKREG
jgi:hypothetical protein